MAIRWLIGTTLAAALVAAGAPARAADVTTPQTYLPITPPAPVTYDFSGAYAGLTAGGQWSTFDTVFGGSPKISSDVTSFTGGPIGGIAFQSDRIVYGIEADVSFNSGDTTELFSGIPVTTESDWFGTLRGRVGYAFDQAMIYGTGGVAAGGVKLTAPGGSDSSTEIGWTLGGGIEVPITDNFTARAEYLYTDLGSKSGTIAGTPFNSEFQSHTVRAGITYKFK